MADRLTGLWGSGVLVVDTSAWSRAHHPQVRDAWIEALLDDHLRLSPAVRLEILLSARDGGRFDSTPKASRRAPDSSLEQLRAADG